jgi:hypothetical protein
MKTGTQGASASNKQDRQFSHPIVRARNLVPTLIAKTGQKLFGASAPLGLDSFQGSAVVPDGNVYDFLAKRVKCYGVEGKDIVVPKSGKLDEVIVSVAKQLAHTLKASTDLADEQIERIALEYVCASVFIATTKVEPFGLYVIQSRTYRTALKALNTASVMSTAEAFEKSNLRTIEQINSEAKLAWGKITQILAQSPHLATLRTQVMVSPLYASMEAWAKLREVKAKTMRPAILAELRTMVVETGNPFISVQRIEEAWSRMDGNLLLSVGTHFGVKVETAVDSMGQSRFTNAVKTGQNGGKVIRFEGASPFDIAETIKGLHGGLTGTVSRKDDKTVAMNFEIQEGVPKASDLAVPVNVPMPGYRTTASQSMVA